MDIFDLITGLGDDDPVAYDVYLNELDPETSRRAAITLSHELCQAGYEGPWDDFLRSWIQRFKRNLATMCTFSGDALDCPSQIYVDWTQYLVAEGSRLPPSVRAIVTNGYHLTFNVEKIRRRLNGFPMLNRPAAATQDWNIRRRWPGSAQTQAYYKRLKEGDVDMMIDVEAWRKGWILQNWTGNVPSGEGPPTYALLPWNEGNTAQWYGMIKRLFITHEEDGIGELNMALDRLGDNEDLHLEWGQKLLRAYSKFGQIQFDPEGREVVAISSDIRQRLTVASNLMLAPILNSDVGLRHIPDYIVENIVDRVVTNKEEVHSVLHEIAAEYDIVEWPIQDRFLNGLMEFADVMALEAAEVDDPVFMVENYSGAGSSLLRSPTFRSYVVAEFGGLDGRSDNDLRRGLFRQVFDNPQHDLTGDDEYDYTVTGVKFDYFTGKVIDW